MSRLADEAFDALRFEELLGGETWPDRRSFRVGDGIIDFLNGLLHGLFGGSVSFQLVILENLAEDSGGRAHS